jgi:hypothetical protein
MLFLQGTRDALADLTLLRPICAALGARATLVEFDGADHGFHLTKSRGGARDVLAELARALRAFAERVAPAS